MREFLGDIVPLLLAASLAAGLAYWFNWRLMKSAREWEQKKQVVQSVENFCDKLMKLSLAYWTTEYSAGSYKEKRLLGEQISAYAMLIARFVPENFPDKAEVRESLDVMIDSITGHNFPEKMGENDSQMVALSVDSLINLRIAVARTMRKK